MQDDPVIQATLKTLEQFHPKSVFLYGSRGRGDAKPDSDYEIGVIFDDGKYVQRSDIHAAVTDPQVKAYPFKWEELLQGTTLFRSAKLVSDPEYRAVIDAAHDVRKTSKQASMDTLFNNISLLDTFIEPKILAAFKVRGNEDII
jgi:hypothetical protein